MIHRSVNDIKMADQQLGNVVHVNIYTYSEREMSGIVEVQPLWHFIELEYCFNTLKSRQNGRHFPDYMQFSSTTSREYNRE